MTGAMVALGLVLALSGLSSSGSMVAGNMILARLADAVRAASQRPGASGPTPRLRGSVFAPRWRGRRLAAYLDALPVRLRLRLVIENL